MRRVIGLCLVGLGTFLIVIAIVLPTFIVGQVTKFPLNEFETATLVATNATYFDASSLTEKSPVNLRATYTIKGDGAAGSNSTAVWNEFSAVNDTTNGVQVQLQSRTFAFDRRTAQLVPYSGDSVNGKLTAQTGTLGFVFPIGTKKQTYDVYDPSLGRTAPFVYTGTTTVRGIEAYVFVENVTPTKVGVISVPGSLIDSTASSVAAPEYYSNHLVYDVDPVTGALINVNEHEVQALYNPATNAQALTLFNADLSMTPASVTSVVGLDTSGRNELNLLQLILPIVLGVVGGIALIAGVLLARQPREDVEAGPTTPAPERAAVPEEEHDVTRASLVPGLDDEAEEAEEETTAESPPASEHLPPAEEPIAPADAAPAATSPAPATSPESAASAASAEEAPAEEAATTTATPAAAPAKKAPAVAKANGGKPRAATPTRARRTTKSPAEPESGPN